MIIYKIQIQLAYITRSPSWNEIEVEEIEVNILTIIVCPIKTVTRYDSLPTVAAKYTLARTC